MGLPQHERMVAALAKEKASTAGERFRNWTFIVYPDSAPANWRDVIDDLHIQWSASPLHEFDTNADGEIKKPHWHVGVFFDGVKTYQQVLEITKKINATIPQKVASAKGLVRYFVHLDNPEKHQYSISDIESHGGLDIAELLKPTSSSRYACIREMIQFIKANDVTSFIDFIEYAALYREDDWFPLLCDNSAFVIDKCINAQWHRVQQTKLEPPQLHADNHSA